MSTHADPTSSDILQRECVARTLANSSDFGLLGEQRSQNGRLPPLDAGEPPCNI